ncbi:efflux RND transporter periplasmic adaptor subunit [Marinibacterium sp. SX1]|uniref:efflux RND transporter periplasmic adaptor subunit n=1 Tax=Marinibacterium sp. SX1 TaxID=3388424 RepID=UPI003D182086
MIRPLPAPGPLPQPAPQAGPAAAFTRPASAQAGPALALSRTLLPVLSRILRPARALAPALALLLAAAPAPASDAPEAEAGPSKPRPVVSEVIRPQAEISRAWVGSVEAEHEISLGFLVLGTMAQRQGELGDVVSRGDVLAQLDAADLDSGVRAAEAGVAIARAQRDTARDANDRASELLDRGVSNQAALDEAANTLAAAEATLREAEAQLEQAREQRSYADLKAPTDGIITAVHAEAGATLDAGDPVFDLAAGDRREVVVSLTQDVASAMQVGAVFDITLISNPAITGMATLVRIDPVSERTSRTRAAHMMLGKDSHPAFRIGALVNARLTAANGPIITLSEGALIADADPPAVWVVTGNDRHLARTPVDIGARAAGRVLVLSGLAEGDEVLTRGVNSVTEGQQVGPRTAPEAIR